MTQLARLSLVAAALTAHSSQALVVFSDNFDNENGGVGVLNFTGFSQWSVTDGTVDLIGKSTGSPFFDLLPGNGLYVDMDGSTGNAGKLSLKTSLNLPAGEYLLSYELAGNQRSSTADSTVVKVDLGLVNQTHSLGRTAPFTLFTQSFTLASPQVITISFEGSGGDNIGMLLDDVKLESVASVPDGGPTVMMLGAALLGTGLGAARNRRTR